MRRDPRIGTTLAGYHIESLLGRGGMSVVYLAEHVRLGRKVALKLLSQELAENPEFRDRFVRESRLAASLDHPNVIPIYEAGEADGELFIAMRYVRGTDLRKLLDTEGRFPVERTVALLSQVAGALDAAHEEGLVHRDVKPANVLIATPPGRGRSEHVYLSDFGLTKRRLSASGVTGTGQLVGTIDYVAPEQIRGEPVDGRTDVYSLGCMAFECLTGQVPFERDSEMAILWAHVQTPPPSATALQPAVPGEVDGILSKAMAKDPADRFPTAGELVDAMASTLAAQTSTSQEPRAPVGATRRLGRRRGLRSAAAAVVAMALIAGAVVLTIRRGGSARRPPAGPSSSATASSGSGSLVGLYRIDPTTGEIVERIPGGRLTGFGRYFAVAAGEGFVWILDADGIGKINPQTNKHVATVPLERSAFDVQVGEGAGWAQTLEGPNAVLYRIDPTTNDATEIPRASFSGIPPFTSVRATGLAVGIGAAWFGNFETETLIRIDGDTLATRELPLPGETSGIVAGDGQLWVRQNGVNASVTRLDPKTGQVLKTIMLTGGADGLAIGGGFVYVADTTNDLVIEINELTNDPFATIAVGDGPTDLAFGDQFLWVVNRIDGSVSKVDPRTRKEVDVIEVPATGGIAVGEGAVWVGSCGRQQSDIGCA